MADEIDLAFILWTIAGAAFALAVVATVADRRRSRRPVLDRVGWVPWTAIQILALFVAIAAAALAVRS
jgi:hypothetical protein